MGIMKDGGIDFGQSFRLSVIFMHLVANLDFGQKSEKQFFVNPHVPKI